MILSCTVNKKPVRLECEPGEALADVLRAAGYKEVKKACGTGNCGLCTILLDEVPVASCSIFAARAEGRAITTIQGLKKEAEELGAYIAAEGAEQCGYCSPGFVLTALAMEREFRAQGMGRFDELAARHYLAGNLCRCSGYQGHMRALKKYWEARNG
ncbi:MAG: 2Fe-2S iron-sulfur cluster-binding protein [Spirochaetia bacterium]|jgi:carbon-monoxide dehydrogenase small subunit|uniref:Putative xanthine dehydrogenase subunit E n=1 Tax=bioreactor metagenome TaxID=1076179 RepID=A0A644VVG0_9ZZZZ|nr:2Fe-2S iron-sulfur cluster-binding protein [Spirochaetia bacterium]MCE1207883.1 2Fe-2S iron-sulfur cluster-binding protein [Spirochaetia bacterium]MDD3820054.1 2Fe-2S iron-sulfur cluster-binding protein [Spirochaetales bacterium]VBB38389.1 (2Fe-2S)-binding domain protein [uncultured Spirochaetota bacterium]